MAALNDARRAFIPDSLKKSQDIDELWTSAFSLPLEQTPIPMWTGFNCWFYSEDIFPKQRICYLPQINQSPTSNAVVLETMDMATRIGEECGQRYMAVTYDLAIARNAYAIQAVEAPRFDRLFILLGPFHIEMSLLKVIGKYIEDSGVPYVLMETGIIAQGSVNGLLSGKSYSR